MEYVKAVHGAASPNRRNLRDWIFGTGYLDLIDPALSEQLIVWRDRFGCELAFTPDSRRRSRRSLRAFSFEGVEPTPSYAGLAEPQAGPAARLQ